MADNSDKPGNEPKTGDGPGSEPTDQNNGDGLEALELTPEQQAKFEGVLTKRLEREREKWAREVEQAKDRAKREADETRLAEQQQFQELANRRQSTITELTGQVETLEAQVKNISRYEKALGGYRDQMIEAHPESIRVLLKSMDVVDQLEWLTANQPDGDEQRRPYVGPPPAPGARGDGKMSAEQKRKESYRPKL